MRNLYLFLCVLFHENMGQINLSIAYGFRVTHFIVSIVFMLCPSLVLDLRSQPLKVLVMTCQVKSILFM